MPELYSRMDGVNWLTPAIQDVLEQGANPPGNSGSIREYMLTLQRELTDLDTPARIINVRSSPSYHLFVARPEMVGKAGNRRTVTPDAIEKSVEKIAEAHPNWQLGFMPVLRGEDNAVGILLRTSDHRPQSLRRMLVRDVFRKHPSTTAFACGITLEQQVIIRDLAEIGHLLIVGKDSAKQHVLQGILLTLLLLNTPGELRLALVGDSAKAHKILIGIPHALGRLLPEVQSGQRLLSGFTKEVQRRQATFQEEGVRTFQDYNARQREKKRPELPRILLLVDAASDASWLPQINDWLPQLSKLIAEGAKVGIHLLVAVDEFNAPDALKTLQAAIQTRIVLRPAAKDLYRETPMHRSQLRFVDAFLVEGRLDNKRETRINPIEICAINGIEIKRAIEYWRNNAKQRQTDASSSSVVSGKTGVTGILQTQEAAMVLVKPPVPEKPLQQTIERVAKALSPDGLDIRRRTMLESDTVERMIKSATSEESTVETPKPSHHSTNETKTVETAQSAEPSFMEWQSPKATDETPAIESIPGLEELAQTEMLPTADFIFAKPMQDSSPFSLPQVDDLPNFLEPADQTVVNENLAAVLNGVKQSPTPVMVMVAPDLLLQARTLAAYLGWLSAGALHDIFAIPYDQAEQMVRTLQEQHILEEGNIPAPRFLSPLPPHLR